MPFLQAANSQQQAALSPATNGLSMALHNFSRRAFSSALNFVNWRRGLFRVRLLISAGWVMGWTIHLIMYSLQGGYSGNRVPRKTGTAGI
jgi:hypothetical protein